MTRAKQQPLPQLMSARMIAEETGLPRSAAETLMRGCRLVRPAGVRSRYVYREDVERLLRERGERT